ncbi:peptidase C39 family protein [Streptomyces olivaceus]
MPPHRPTPHRVPAEVPYEPADWPAPLRRIAPADVLERWSAADRGRHAPRLVAVPDGDGWAAAALVTARPRTAYLKIVDVVGHVPTGVAAVVSYARERGLAQVTWEGWTVGAEAAAAAGFTALRPPPAPGAGPEAAFVRWLDDVVVPEPPYYRQSTDFTCGAVTALVAQAQTGAEPHEPLDRPAELTLWRDATNFPACEPVGLGVAVRRRWPSSPVEVLLDTDRPVLLDHCSDGEREWRAVLQRASRTDAGRLGVPIRSRRLSLDGLRGAVGRGEHVLLLVSLAAMQGFDVPHWVLCHAVVPGAVVLEDPWFNTGAGDTWADAHLLPVADASLDAMSLLTDRPFRGAVRIGRPALRD